MTKSKKSSSLGAMIGVVLTLAVIVCCTACSLPKRLSGSYKSEAAGSMFGMDYSLGSVTYTFSGSNKVSMETEVTILGSSKTTKEGTYEIEGNEITFTFPEEKKKDDGTTETVDKSYTYSFYKGEDTIKIDNTEYTKVK